MLARTPAVASVLALIALVGCSGTRTEKFDVLIKNEASKPVTISLAKNGPPFEPAWASPEDVAIESPRNDEKWGIAALPPGKEASVSLDGRFEPSTRGYLRVYAGDLTISEMLAVSRGSPDRLDLPLSPGRNAFVITDAGGTLKASEGPPPAAPAARP